MACRQPSSAARACSSALFAPAQVGFTHYWLAGANKSRAADEAPSVALDYGARLFLTLPRFQSSALLRTPNGSLVSAWAPSSPLCFIHPAGSKRPAFVLEGGFNYSVLGLY